MAAASAATQAGTDKPSDSKKATKPRLAKASADKPSDKGADQSTAAKSGAGKSSGKADGKSVDKSADKAAVKSAEKKPRKKSAKAAAEAGADVPRADTSPMEATPVVASPTDAAPTEATPTEAAPTDAASVDATSAKSTPLVAHSLSAAQIASIVDWRSADPFALLGMHASADGQLWVRCLMPDAAQVQVSETGSGEVVATLQRVHEAGLFEGVVPARHARFDYRLLVRWPGQGDDPVVVDDPYHYGPILGDTDLWLLTEGSHQRPYERLGAHPTTIGGSAGTVFAVWAPNASVVSVIGEFNRWDERRHPMRLRSPSGIWELFIPGVGPGSTYKFALRDRHGHRLPDHADPFARQTEMRPATASIVAAPLLSFDASAAGAAATQARNSLASPISIYEVHAGSWRRIVDEGNRFLNWDELADQMIPYVLDMGFTHIELLPVSEHPFDGSWGYQPTGLFAPTSRFGPPEGFRRFVDRCHEAGLGVLLDWVPGHFPNDAFALAQFDGTHLYDHADPREGLHRDWGTLIYNYGRNEVRNFLIGNARYWIEQYGIDGLRVDAVASMLYRDYSREPGQWVPNEQGGRENLEAIGFLKEMNESLGASHPGVTTIAEESTAWPGVSRPTSGGGLGFHYKWNMGWMNDTLKYMSRDPMHRRYHHSELSFGLVYAFDEHFVLPLSHDEVVHGKRSLIGRMPGDSWQRFANLRLYYTFMFTHPGKKLLFMGAEFAQEAEWNHDRSLDWHLLGDDPRRGIQTLVKDLNRLYRGLPALHEMDARPEGFAWIAYDDAENSVLSYVRRSMGQTVIVVCNFTPVPRQGYRIGAPKAGRWVERLNSDSSHYGGSNKGNDGWLTTEAVASHGHPQSLALIVPPLGALVLEWIE